MPTLAFSNGGTRGDYEAVALRDDGALLARIHCSEEWFMMRDLREQLGPDVRIEWVANPETDPRVQAALELYRARGEGYGAPKRKVQL